MSDSAHQTSLSMEFSRLEYWSGLPFPSPVDITLFMSPTLSSCCGSGWNSLPRLALLDLTSPDVAQVPPPVRPTPPFSFLRHRLSRSYRWTLKHSTPDDQASQLIISFWRRDCGWYIVTLPRVLQIRNRECFSRNSWKGQNDLVLGHYTESTIT